MSTFMSLSKLLLLFAVGWSNVNAISEDAHPKCQQWASSGECDANPSYMLVNCAFSCEQDKISLNEANAEDKHEKCAAWASSGECTANPGYMLRNCRKSCPRPADSSSTVEIPSDFYSITERDIYGNMVYFEQFRGKTVFVVNVASQCGYTAENYKLLQLLSGMRSDRFEILIYPCNQFGGQEPGDADEISYFAAQFGFEGRVMAKGNVNGRDTGSTFRFLKHRSGKQHISWNFDGKFLVSSTGEVEVLTLDTAADVIAQRLGEDTSSLSADL